MAGLNRTLKNGTVVSDKMTQNFVEGSGITLTVTDDGRKANIQIDASAAATTYATTAELADVAATEAAGTSGTIPRGDHRHAHEPAHLAHDTLWDTKGDLAVATGADAAAKLGVGSTANFLGTDSNQTSGLAWAKQRYDYLMPTGAVAESRSRAIARADNDAQLQVSGTVVAIAVVLYAGQTVTTISWLSGATPGSSMTHQFFGLHDSAKARLAVSADDTSTAWSANTIKTLNMVTPYPVTTTGLYYASLLVTHSAGAVPSQIYGSLNTVPVALTPVLCATADTGQTSIPTTLGALTALNAIPYFYLS